MIVLSIPPLQAEVFSFLSVREVVRVSLVSKSYFATALSNPFLWQRFYATYFYGVPMNFPSTVEDFKTVYTSLCHTCECECQFEKKDRGLELNPFRCQKCPSADAALALSCGCCPCKFHCFSCDTMFMDIDEVSICEGCLCRTHSRHDRVSTCSQCQVSLCLDCNYEGGDGNEGDGTFDQCDGCANFKLCRQCWQSCDPLVCQDCFKHFSCQDCTDDLSDDARIKYVRRLFLSLYYTR